MSISDDFLLLDKIPKSKPLKTGLNILLLTNVPFHKNPGKIIWTLKKLSQECGGNFFKVGQNKAVIYFLTANAAVKAQRQMNKKCVYGEELLVTFYCGADFSACVCPFKRNDIQPSIISGERKGEQKNNIIDPSCSKFHLSATLALDTNTSLLNNCNFEEFADTNTSLMPCERCMGNLQYLLHNIITLLKENGSEIRMFFFTFLYEEKYGIIPRTSDYGFENIDLMFKHFPYHFRVKGKKLNRSVFLISDDINILDDFIRSYTSKPNIKSNMREGCVSMSSLKIPAHGLLQTNNSLPDSKLNVISENFNLTRSQIPPVDSLHCAEKSLLHTKTGLVTTYGESSFKITEKSFKTSSAEIVSPSDSRIKSSTMPQAENQYFSSEEVPIYTEKDCSKNCFSNDQSKLTMTQVLTCNTCAKFEKRLTRSQQKHNSNYLEMKTNQDSHCTQKFHHHLISPPKISSQKSSLMPHHKNQDFKYENEISTYFEKDKDKKCFPYEPLKFKMKQDAKFEKEVVKSLKDHHNPKFLKKKMKHEPQITYKTEHHLVSPRGALRSFTTKSPFLLQDQNHHCKPEGGMLINSENGGSEKHYPHKFSELEIKQDAKFENIPTEFLKDFQSSKQIKVKKKRESRHAQSISHHLVSPTEVLSVFPAKSPSVSQSENHDCKPKEEMPVCSKTVRSNKNFSYDLSKLGTKPSGKVEKSSIRPLQEYDISGHSKKNMKQELHGLLQFNQPLISQSAVFTDFSLKLPFMSQDKNKGFNPTGQVLVYSGHDGSNICFTHDSPKFEKKQRAALEKSTTRSLEGHGVLDHYSKETMKRELRDTQQFNHHLISTSDLPSKVSSKVSPKSTFIAQDENQDFIPGRQVSIHSKNDGSNKSFPHDSLKFEMKPDVKFDKNSIHSLQSNPSSEILEQKIAQESFSSRQFHPYLISSFKCKNHFFGIKELGQSTKNTFTSEMQWSRPNRIAAKFTVPILW